MHRLIPRYIKGKRQKILSDHFHDKKQIVKDAIHPSEWIASSLSVAFIKNVILSFTILFMVSIASSTNAANPRSLTASGQGNPGDITSVSIAIDNAADIYGFDFTLTFDPNVITPVLNSGGSPSVSSSVPSGWSYAASNPNSNQVKFLAYTFSTNTLSSGPLTIATFSFQVAANAASGNSPLSLSGEFADINNAPISVYMTGGNFKVLSKTNNPPVMSDPGAKSVDEGQALSFTVTATDADGDPLSYSATGLPNGAAFDTNTQLFSWTPDYTQSTASPYTVTFTVSDGRGGTDSKNVQITVVDKPVGNPILVVPTDPINKKIGEEVLFQVTATDPGGNDVLLTAAPLPSGATFQQNATNPASGTFDWTAGQTITGSYSVTFSANNSKGGVDTKTVIIVISPSVNNPPIINVPADTLNWKTLVKNSFTVTASDPDAGDIVTLTAVSLPDGATFDPATGIFSWTPTAAQIGEFKPVFIATDNHGGTTSTNPNSGKVTIDVTSSGGNHPPVFSSPTSAPTYSISVNQGVALPLTITATDPDVGDTVTLSSGTLPSGATFNLTTGIFNWTPTFNQSGVYTVIFYAEDTFSVTTQLTIQITVNTSDRNPVLTVPGAQSGKESQALSFAVSAIDPDGDAVTLSETGVPTGASFNAQTGAFAWTPGFTQSGDYTITFKADDGKGGSDSKTVSIHIANVDRNPVLTVPGAQSGRESQALSFSVSATDPDTGDTVTLSATGLPTGASFNAQTGAFTWTPSVGQAGDYSITFKADDGNGGIDSKTVAIHITNVNRNPVLTVPGAQSGSEGQALSFSVSATDPDGDAVTLSASGLPTGASFNAQTGAFSWTPGFTQSGDYTITFKADDGKSGSDSKTVSIHIANVDRNPVLTVPGAQSGRESQALSFSVSATDPDGDAVTLSASGLPTGASFNAQTGVFSWTPSVGQAGDYVITFKADDGNGGSDSKAVSIHIVGVNQDRNPVLTVPGAQSGSESQALSFSVSATDPDGDAVTLSATGLPTGASFSAQTGAFFWTPGLTQSGDYTITFKADDGKGGTDSKTVAIHVENITQTNNHSPSIVLPGDQKVKSGSTLTFKVSATDPDEGDTVTISSTDMPDGSTFNSNTGSFTWKPNASQVGDYYVAFIATDSHQGSDTKVVYIIVTNVNQNPVLTIPGAQSGSEGQSLSFTVSATDPDAGDVVTLSATGLPTGASFNAQTGAFTWTPGFTQSGDYTVTFKADDGNGGIDSKTVTIHVANIDQNPVLTVPGAQSGSEGQALSFGVSATDPDAGDVVTLSATGLPTGASFNAQTGAFSWTPGFTQSGDYTITFKADDGKGGIDSKTVTIHVAIANQNPVLTVPGAQSGNESQALSFSVSATDPDGDAVTLSATGLPASSSFNAQTGAFSWTPSLTQSGDYTITFKADDGKGGIDSKTVSIHIANVDRNPVLTVPVAQSGSESQSLSFGVSGTDPDGDAVTLSATGLPAGSSFNAQTGAFSWTPSYAQAGDYVVSFKADDGKGGSDSKTVVIHVANVDRNPVLTVPGAQSGSEGQSLSFGASATDPDGDAVTLSATGLPAGSSFNAQTGAFSWTPSAGQAGDYVVTFKADDGKGGSDAKTVKIHVGAMASQGSITLSSGFAQPGETINIPVNVDGISNITDINISMEFKNSLTSASSLSLFDIQMGADVKGGQINKEINGNQVNISISGITSIVSGKALLNLIFKVSENAIPESEENLSIVNATVNYQDTNGNRILVAPTSNTGIITVGLLGDINNDGKVVIGDATALLKFVLNPTTLTPELLWKGDLAPKNSDGSLGDGKLNIQDVTRLLRKVVGLEEF